jgi:integrase
MARRRTGTVQRFTHADGSTFYRARLRLGDGSRPWADIPAEHGRTEARKHAARLQELEDERGEVLAARRGAALGAEIPARWFERWHAERRTRGLRSVDTEESRIRDYVLPYLRGATMASVTRDELEDVRDGLDAKIRAGKLSWKTCANTWGLVTKAFADALNSKRRELRARTDNPVLGIAPPERGEHKSKVYLYPSEALALLSCPDVPLRWRRVFALTIYLYARPGEIRALTWEDGVDLERGVVHIHKSIDRQTGEIKSTKTDTPRRVPIEPALRPLLEAMHAEQGGKGRLVPWGGTDRKLSRQLQRCLRLADVKRSDLYESDSARKAMTFYDLRATGATWCAVRGDDPLRIKQRCGHRSFATTEVYIREAENLGATNFGKPFPPLPASLLEGERSTERFTEEAADDSTAVITMRENGGGAGNRTRVRKFRGQLRLRAYPAVYLIPICAGRRALLGTSHLLVLAAAPVTRALEQPVC